MRNKSSGVLGTLVVFAAAALASAQFDVNGPNAEMRLQGLVASTVDPVGHQVQVGAPGSLQFSIRTGTNPGVGVLLLSGTTAPAVFATPWSGSIDVGVPNPAPPFIPTGILVLGDGIFQTAGPLDPLFVADTSATPEFRLSLSVPGIFAGNPSPGYQGIVLDPSNPPFFFDNTEVAEPNYFSGQVLTVNTGDDNSIQVSLTGGKTFNYFGVAYTDFFVNGNCLLSFTAPLGFPGAFYAGNTRSQLNDVPHISLNWADWNITQQALSNGVLLVENGLNCTITWGGSLGTAGTNQAGISHFGDTDVAVNSLSLDLDDGLGSNPAEGTITMNWNLDPNATGNNDAVVGIVAGAGLGSQNFNQDFHANPIGLTNDSLVEEHDSAGALTAAQRIGYDGLGGRQCYHSGFRKFDGQTVTFTPNPASIITGDNGYSVSTAAPRPTDAIPGLSPDTGDYNGGTLVTICGWFRTFDTIANPAVGSVILDPSGANLPAVVVSVLDNSGTNDIGQPFTGAPQYRDHEGLVILTPANGTFTGPVDVQVNFENGDSFLLPGAFTYTAPGSLTTTYNALSDDGNVLHVLSTQPNVTFGTVVYTQFYVNANGMVTFSTSSGDFTQTRAEMDNGFRTAGAALGTSNPGVAVLWTDQNFPTAVGDDVQVIEDGVAGTVKVFYRNQGYWNGGTPSGSYSVTFNVPSADSLEFNHSGVINGTNAGSLNQDRPIIGISAGSDDPSFGYAFNDIDLTGTPSVGIGSGVSYGPGSLYQAFGGFDLAGPNWGPVDLQTVNGNGIWQAIAIGPFTYILF